MKIKVALNKSSIHRAPNGYTWISGEIEEFYFDDIIAKELEKDGFLTEMWNKLDALFDWGDYDYFAPDKCILFQTWLTERLQKSVNPLIKPVYEAMLDYANKAIKNDTGISFDF